MSHKDWLLNGAKTICLLNSIAFEIQEENIIVNDIVFTEWKKALSYIYELESKA